MEVVTRYKVGDRLFEDEIEARSFENFMVAIEAAHAVLGSAEGLDYNGGNFIQHDAASVVDFLAATHRALVLSGHIEEAQMWLSNPKGLVGRFLDDSNNPARDLYWRYQRIDSQHREWGQPYFANNPNPEAVAL